MNEWYYFVIDMTTDNSSLTYRNKKLLKLGEHRDFVPHIYEAIKYTGDKR